MNPFESEYLPNGGLNHFPDPDSEAPYEEGFPLPEAEPEPHLPPGQGRFALPPYMTFSQIVNYASRTFRYTHDEALRHNQNNALAVRRDPVIFDALRQRQIPTAQLPWHLECEDDQDERQNTAVADLTDIIEHIPRFQQLKMHLLEAIYFGRYGVQTAYSWDFSSGKKRLMLRDFRPINGDKLVFKYSGQAGVLVHATFPGSWSMTDRGRAHFFTSQEREQIIIHKHEPEDSDFFEPELAGGLMGLGLRGRLYWYWWLKLQVMAMLMDYLERVGAGGFTIYYYEAGDNASLQEVKAAAEEQYKNNTILFPRYRDGSTGGPGIERVEPSMAGAALLQALVTEYFDNLFRRLILGQTQVDDAKGAGLGSGISDYLEGNLGRLIKYDAINLADTLTTDLVAVLQRYMYPDVPPIRFVFDVDKPNAGELLEAAEAFFNMGGAIDEDQLRSVIGLEKPQAGHSMLAKMGAMSPAAAGSIPQGVPLLGQPGPEAGPAGGEGMPPGAPPEGPGPGGPPPAGGPPMMLSRRGLKRRLTRRRS